MIRLVAALLCAALLCLPTRVQADNQIGGKRVALVIGNGAYRSVERLPNAANDARLIAATLKGLGFELVGGDAQLDLDRAGMERLVSDFGHALAGADVGLFYYSGHGLQVQGVNWLVPVSANPARPQDLDFQMLDASLVLRQMDGAGTKLNLVMLDACRNNPFSISGLRALQGGLAEMRAPEGTLISYATQPGNVAVDGAGADSPYTLALAEGMRQPGQDIFRMFNKVGLDVKRRTGGSQQPWVSTSPIDGEFFFAGKPAAAPAAAPTVEPLTAPVPRQMAGIAPLPVLPPPPDPRLAMARGRVCSVLDAFIEGDQVYLRGIAVRGPDWDAFIAGLGVNRSIRPSEPPVEFVPAFSCAALATLGSAMRATREQGVGRLLTSIQRSAVAGQPLTLTVQAEPEGAVAIDLFRADGMVEHLATASPDGLVPRRTARAMSATTPAGSPPGPRLLVALVTAAPLPPRPPVERATGYLAALRQSLPAEASVGAAAVDVQPGPVVAAPPHQPITKAATAAPRPSRCGAILERAQIGEALSDGDRAYLRAQCR